MVEIETHAGNSVTVSSVNHGGLRRIVLASTDQVKDATAVVLLSADLARTIARALLDAASETDGVAGQA